MANLINNLPVKTMTKSFFTLLLLAICAASYSQTVEDTIPGTFFCPNDTFVMKHKGLDKLFPFRASKTDNGSPGGNASPGDYATIYYGNDSLRLNYHNRLPYAHIIYVNFSSPKGKSTFRFHFDEPAAYFPEAYRRKNNGNIQFDIPEPYELANIIWTLSPTGQRAADLDKEGEYYKKVEAWFKPYAGHPVFKALDFPDSLYFDRYYNFRENSFAFNFKNDHSSTLLFNGPYYYVFGRNLADSSLFGKLKPLVEDFAATSKFREFYKNNLGYYHKTAARQKALLPVKKMWTWMEEQFPNRKFSSYRIVFSPLIGGSHSTQQYSTFSESGAFRETVMFICGPDRYDKIDSLTEIQKEGLLSGIVFTEIDHNYVNPATSRYQQRVDSIFSNRSLWVKADIANNNYRNPVSVFNEYMTHALFCLYMLDSYDTATANFVIDNREQLMVNRRNFIRFKEFKRELVRLRQLQKDVKVIDLYPAILSWCAQQR